MIIDVTVSVCRLLLGFENYCSTRVTVTVVSGDASWVTTGKTKLFSDALEFFFCLCTRLFCMIFFLSPTEEGYLGITEVSGCQDFLCSTQCVVSGGITACDVRACPDLLCHISHVLSKEKSVPIRD